MIRVVDPEALGSKLYILPGDRGDKPDAGGCATATAGIPARASALGQPSVGSAHRAAQPRLPGTG